MEPIIAIFVITSGIIFWIIPTFVPHSQGVAKRLLGWLGVITLALLPPAKKAEIVAARNYRECPSCKEDMRRDASVCPYCWSEVWWEVVDPRYRASLPD